MSDSTSPSSQRLVIACGGTGGHLFPGIAVAQAAQRRGWETLLLISEKQIDSLATQGHDDLRFERVPAIAMPPVTSPAMLKFLWKFYQTRKTCRRIIADFRATAVLGMGGFTSLPPVMAGRKLGTNTFIHESNAVPGKANRLTAKYCTAVLLGLADCAAHFPGRETRVTGTPLRSGLVPVDRAGARAFFGLAPDRETVLIMGGSQGARGVNRAVVESLAAFDPARVQLLHIAGPAGFAEIEAAYAAVPALTAHVAPFCQKMEAAYSAADVAVSRSGASSLTELSAFGLPSVLVPYPTAADDHQRRNADVFTRAGAAIAIEETELTGGRLATVLTDLLGDAARRAALSAAMKSLAPGDAADRVCEVIAAAGKA